jgi:ABC-type transport system involved in multi-copper enzyme maturation permease subunit
MNPLNEIFLVMQRELRKNTRSIKGIVLLVLALLGSGAFALLNAYVTRIKKRELGDMDDSQLKQARELALTKIYDGDADLGKYLSDAPEIIYSVSWVLIWLTPLVVAILGYDGIAGEVQHRSVRYWSVRSRKTSYFFGKFFGLWVTTIGFTLTVQLLVWAIATVGGVASAGTIFGWGFRFWLTSIPIAGAWSGLATLVASQFRTPMVSLLTVCGVFFVFFVLKLIGMGMENEYVMYMHPGALDQLIMHPQLKRSAIGVGVAAAFALATSSAGAAIFQKRDV